jgi:hypothetical protein
MRPSQVTMGTNSTDNTPGDQPDGSVAFFTPLAQNLFMVGDKAFRCCLRLMPLNGPSAKFP